MRKANIQFFGSSESCEKALILLENHPGIKRIDTAPHSPRTWSLLFHENVQDMKLIPLLAKSGINGFRLF